MPPPDRSVYFDDYARKQSSPTRNQTGVGQGGASQISGLSRPPNNGGGACEWDRLMREREELLKTGTYTEDDPLIKEIERQIQASQVRDGTTSNTFNNRVSAQ